jgi:hypothetical protein
VACAEADGSALELPVPAESAITGTCPPESASVLVGEGGSPDCCPEEDATKITAPSATIAATALPARARVVIRLRSWRSCGSGGISATAGVSGNVDRTSTLIVGRGTVGCP